MTRPPAVFSGGGGRVTIIEWQLALHNGGQFRAIYNWDTMKGLYTTLVLHHRIDTTLVWGHWLDTIVGIGVVE